MDTDRLATAFMACATGIYAAEADVAVLIANGTFLHRDDFTSRLIEHGTSGGNPMAAIDWEAATAALASGGLSCSGGERRILQLSACSPTAPPSTSKAQSPAWTAATLLCWSPRFSMHPENGPRNSDANISSEPRRHSPLRRADHMTKPRRVIRTALILVPLNKTGVVLQDWSGPGPMKLTWAEDGYRMAIDSAREHHLVRDSLVESAYIVDGLPDRECQARLGCSKAELQEAIDLWGQFDSLRTVSVPDLETIKSCFFETLDFFSESDYRMRTGWAKEESRLVFERILADRRAITTSRLWG